MSFKLASLLTSVYLALADDGHQLEFEKDKNTKEAEDVEDEEGSDNEISEKVKSSENVSIKEMGSSEKLPLSEDEEDDKNISDSKASSAPGTGEKKKP
jgi:hypothetical protein